jgi:propionyl-CoA carboxylase alpha chain
LHGITTNRDLLVRILRHPEFLAGDIDTGFLVRHDPAQLGAPLASPHAEKLHAIAAAMAAQASRRSKTPVLPGLPSGWRNNASEPQKESFAGRNATFDVSYLFDRTGRCVEVSCSTAEDTDDDLVGTSCGVSVATAEPERVVIASGTLETAYSVQLVDEHVFVDGPDGSSSFLRVERFPLPGSQLQPGSLIAPLPGTVVRVEVKVGDSVSGGDVLIAIEAMKMEHEVRAGHAGVVEEVAVAPGDQVESGRLLVVVKEGESTS